jgi:hypothetical protein
MMSVVSIETAPFFFFLFLFLAIVTDGERRNDGEAAERFEDAAVAAIFSNIHKRWHYFISRVH